MPSTAAYGTYKVNTDSGNIALCVCIVGKTKEQARLSDTGVTDEEELEEVVVSGCIVSRVLWGGGGGDRSSREKEGDDVG